jgi:hypothetical protein
MILSLVIAMHLKTKNPSPNSERGGVRAYQPISLDPSGFSNTPVLDALTVCITRSLIFAEEV